jgi:uncharacterized membrane protein
MAKQDHHHTARTVLSLILVIVMARIFFIFNENSEYIITSNQFNLFITLSVVAGGLMIGLLYLAGKNPHSQKATHKPSSRRTTRKKSSR